MVLIDTSAWISFFNNQSSLESKKVLEFLENDEVCICPTVLQELLQGIKNDKDFFQIKGNLLALDFINYDPVETAIGAAELYRTGRKRGFTIRKSNDCLIAWCAIKASIPVFSIDRDFNKIAEFSKLKLFNT